jgi:hypothetical protein
MRTFSGLALWAMTVLACSGRTIDVGTNLDGGGSSSGSSSGITAGVGPEVVYLGGFMNGRVWENNSFFDGSSWSGTVTVGDEPSSRAYLAMATLGDKAVLFGGQDVGALGDTWLCNGLGGQLPFTEVSGAGGPTGRYGHAMATLGDKVVLFGGTDGSGAVNSDTWLFDGAHWTAVQATGPSARTFHSLVAVGNTVVLFGGSNAAGQDLADTWVFDGTSWTMSSATGPGPRHAHAMGSLGSSAVLFGGEAIGADLGDTWIFDGVSWQEVGVTGKGPVPRHFHAMATFGAGESVLLGGLSAGDAAQSGMADSWIFNGTRWLQVGSFGFGTWGMAIAQL